MVKKVKSLFMLERTSLNCPASLQASHLNDFISLPIFYDNIVDHSCGTLIQWKRNNYLGGIGTKAGGLGATRQ